jgi:hypothetical protein
MLKLTQSHNVEFLDSVITSNSFTEIYAHLAYAELYYPDFQKWYYQKVVPGIFSREREIIVEKRGDEIAGIAILKKKSMEQKLCTLRISHEFQNKGIGLRLFERSFESLQDEKPFLTVSEEKLHEFKRIFDYFGFQLTSIHDDLYRVGKKEYFFNER